jgi:hypothetical protein
VGALPVIGGEIGWVVNKLYGEPIYKVGYRVESGRPELSTLEFVLALVWWFVILAVFGGAICRVVASRIARDEGVGVKEALAFSIKNLPSYVIAPIAVGLAILFFWACILLAGLVVSIPFIGPILSVILYPLTILAGLIIVLIGFGGVLGLLLMVSAVSTERNGALDAVSRAFSYIYSRPLQFFFSYFLIFLFAYIIFLVGNVFIGVTSSSFLSGIAADSGHLDILAKNVGSNALTPDFSDAGFYGVAVAVIWFLHRILWWGIAGYVVYYVLGGTTALYFQLRRDVDGTEESEIYLEDGQEDEFDFAVSEPPSPEAPAAGAAETPAPETAAPEAPAPEAPAAEEPAPEAPADEGEPADEDEEKKPDGEG